MANIPGWRPALGQTGAAQGHLSNNGVGAGDVFLFFGWFRQVEKSRGSGALCRVRRICTSCSVGWKSIKCYLSSLIATCRCSDIRGLRRIPM
ncbi:hypothetical protein EMIT0158MI4_310005 [Burkholderia ambifaria]